MHVKDIMTKDPACCTPETKLQEVAQLMVQHDCGCIPVIENTASRKPVGTITDRDICCRTVAEGKNPLEMKASDCMTTPAVTITPETSIEDCCHAMEEKQVRRVPVVDERGGCCGMVAQADVARHVAPHKTGDVVKRVSS